MSVGSIISLFSFCVDDLSILVRVECLPWVFVAFVTSGVLDANIASSDPSTCVASGVLGTCLASGLPTTQPLVKQTSPTKAMGQEMEPRAGVQC